jgi:glycosyltransferase involved in cell wall biosynthesis
VLVLDSIIFNLQRAGGISKYWAKLLGGYHQRKLNYQEIVYENDNIFSRDLAHIPSQSFPVRINRYLDVKCKAKKDTVFHSSYFRLPKSEMPTVCTVHDFMYELFDKGIKKRIHIWQKRRCMINSDVIICVSEHTKNDLYRLYPKIAQNKHVEVIYNGVDDDFINLELASDYLIEINGFVLHRRGFLLYVGSRNGCKNFNEALSLASDFIKRNPSLKFVCVGGGGVKESEILNFPDMIGKVIHLSFIENEQLNILYNIAFSLVFTSSYEGFGIPALEAQKAGCPVIYQSISSLSEVMGYNDTDINSRSYSDIYHSINDDLSRSDIIRKGIEKASFFSWNLTVDNTLKAYRKAIEIYKGVHYYGN